jgi:hypothetical protein
MLSPSNNWPLSADGELDKEVLGLRPVSPHCAGFVNLKRPASLCRPQIRLKVSTCLISSEMGSWGLRREAEGLSSGLWVVFTS